MLYVLYTVFSQWNKQSKENVIREIIRKKKFTVLYCIYQVDLPSSHPCRSRVSCPVFLTVILKV